MVNSVKDKRHGVHDHELQGFSWKEVAQHNSKSSCWIIIKSHVYDITEWISKHPGGEETLLLAAGRDCTNLFQSYHTFTTRPANMLAEFEIGFVSKFEFPQYSPDTGFYREVCERIAAYFSETKQDPKALFPALCHLACFMLVAWASFGAIWSPTLSVIMRVAAAVVFGIFQGLLLSHTMHDASHFTLGHSAKYWKFFGRLAGDWFCGASMFSWHHSHTLGHHLYLNVLGIDPDLPPVRDGDCRRVAPSQTWKPFYRFQHLYVALLYPLVTIKARFDHFGDILREPKGAAHIRLNFATSALAELCYQLIVKMLWLGWRIVIPAWRFHVPILQAVGLNILIELVTGLYLDAFFVVAHQFEHSEFSDLEETLQMSDRKNAFRGEWAVSQVKSSLDFAHNATFLTFFSGALNYQTIHHLFPGVSQYYYPELAPIVQEVCKKYGIRYNVIGSYWDALSLHFSHLKLLGRKQ